MGATTFLSTAPRGRFPDARAAFRALVDEAQYEYGHGGYTGTIAEKSAFVTVGTAPDQGSALAIANAMLDAGDPRVDDKWGPAGHIRVSEGPTEHVFFGWASE